MPPRAALVVAGRQEHDRVAIDGVSFEVVLERPPVNLDALDDGRARARHRVGHVRLDLRGTRQKAAGDSDGHR